jgi:hypothetical protein
MVFFFVWLGELYQLIQDVIIPTQYIVLLISS